MNITDFLLARVAEDEADAINRVVLRSEDRRSVTMDDAEKIHAECAAKRAIIKKRQWIDRSAGMDDWHSGYSDANYDAIKALAFVYKAHSDYQEEWA